LRGGDQVSLFPYFIPHVPTLYDEPERFRHDRFAGDGGRALRREGARPGLHFMPFGGGVSICPGRFLAREEIKQLVALLLLRFELRLESSELPPRDLTRAGLGIFLPRGDVTVA